MAQDTTGPRNDLIFKIARLVEEKGWNGEDFARISQLNRHTVRQILHGGSHRRLRNATIGQCAEAFGLTVSELRTLPLERLLARIHGQPSADEKILRRLGEQASLPEFLHWIQRNPDRVAALQPEEVAELLELQTPGGPMERLGVEHFVEQLERRRELLRRVRIIAGTEYLSLLEQLVGLLFEKTGQPRT
ncbi:MAG: hypothetical protein LC104_02010 [Bacteroidales bacterium]|nr:hypothetical protein [Bacteroidales bacterium]